MNEFREYSTGQLAEKLEKLVDNTRVGSRQMIGVVLADLFEACAERLLKLDRPVDSEIPIRP